MEECVKLIVFVPEEAVDKVRLALGKAGAGHIGDYDYCSFVTPGLGYFRPLEGSSPYIGREGDIEEVEELRVETIVPESRLADVLTALRASHPYEEIAFDLVPLVTHRYRHLVPKRPC